MVNGAFHFHAAAGDLALQTGDPALQLGDGQRIEILAHELCEEIAGTGERVVQVHEMQR
jgi:hypothetical protein